MDGHDIRMVEGRDDLSLALESAEPRCVACELVGENLQCNITLEVEIAGAIHLAHPARTDRTEDFEVADPKAEPDRHGRGFCRRRER